MSSTGEEIIAAVTGNGNLVEYERCPICRNYGWTNTHKCPTKWQAILHEYYDEEEPGYVYCNGDAQEAVELFADQNYSNWDYPRNMEIWVRKDTDEPWDKFDVYVEAVPSFSSSRKGDPT